MTLTRILAPVGEFPQDDAVLGRALEIAAMHHAALVIVHVMDLPGEEGDIARPDTLLGQAAVAARGAIASALGRLGASAAEPDIRIEAGSPALALLQLCDELAPDLVVMRAHQGAGIAQKILGSTTDWIVAAARLPVLVVKRVPRTGYGTAIVATSDTDDARALLRCTRGLLPDTALHLVEVVRIQPQLEEAMLRTGTDQRELKMHRAALVRNARNRLIAASAKGAPGVKTHVLRGDPTIALCRASRIAGVDLIVAGRGRSSLLRRAFIGSVTRRLLRDADCDVLLCGPEAPRA